MEGIGLGDLEMEHALSALLAMVRGLAVSQLAGFRHREGSMTDLEWWTIRAPLLEVAAGEGSFPLASRLGLAVGTETHSTGDPHEAFRFGLLVWMSGLRTMLAGRTPDAVPQRG